jgi:hypothetical protein
MVTPTVGMPEEPATADQEFEAAQNCQVHHDSVARGAQCDNEAFIGARSRACGPK